MDDPLRTAHRIADQVLFPAASAVDAADRVPAGHFAVLAEAGCYALCGPVEAGGLVDLPTQARVVEILAGGCLTTAFVWSQHFSAVRAVAAAGQVHRDRWLAALCQGTVRAGVVQAALRPGPPSLRCRPVPGGYRLTGQAPWVTGWGMVHLLHTAARDEHDVVHWLLLDALDADSLRAEPLALTAVAASGTVTLHFQEHFVPAERLVARVPYHPALGNAPRSMRLNGALALGVAGRAAGLGDDAGMLAEIDACRAAQDGASTEPGVTELDRLARARAAGAELALTAAARLGVRLGSRSVLRGEPAGRLLREAGFLLVFATRPAIRAALLTRLTCPGTEKSADR